METSGIKYIGSKFNLLEEILSFVKLNVKTTGIPSMIDVFTGTTRVAQAFRQNGWTTQTSDLSWASESYAHTFLHMNSNKHLAPIIDDLNKIRPKEGWLTKNYCDAISAGGTPVRVWQPHNGQKADAIRDKIETLTNLTVSERSTLITALIFGLDKVDNTVGIQQAYLKNWCNRSYNDLQLTLPNIITMKQPPATKHYVGDCLKINYESADLAYLDPPYSSHNYSSYYHIWDSIAKWDKPEVGLKTNRRIDRVTSADEYDSSMSSPWNSKSKAAKAFEQLIQRLPVKYIMISYNNESLVPIDELINLCRKYGTVKHKQIDYKRNIMSKIGNGEVGADRNLEYLILLTKK